MPTFFVTSVKANESIRLRLREVFRQIGTADAVSGATGIKKATLDNILSGRVESMKDVHLSAICVAYPALDIRYVLTGERTTPDQRISQLTDDMQAVYEISGRALEEPKTEN